MNIEFKPVTNEARFNYRTNPKPFSEQPSVVQEAILVVAGKESKDLYEAKGCGCRQCDFRVSEVKEFYGAK